MDMSESNWCASFLKSRLHSAYIIKARLQWHVSSMNVIFKSEIEFILLKYDNKEKEWYWMYDPHPKSYKIFLYK